MLGWWLDCWLGEFLLKPSIAKWGRCQRRYQQIWHVESSRFPSSARLITLFGEGSPTKIDCGKKGTLVLTSLLEDLVIFRVGNGLWVMWVKQSVGLSIGG